MNTVKITSCLLAVYMIFSTCILSVSQHQQISPVDIRNHQVIIPNLPDNHYLFWLKNNKEAIREFEEICSKVPDPLKLKDVNQFQKLHENLTIENPRYLNDLDYGKNLLNSLCNKLIIIDKYCWGYEKDCENIYLMPDCYYTQTGGHSIYSQAYKAERDQKISWFNQADFGYILEKRREINRYCAPDKQSNDTIKSSLECTKYFRTCRGQNLYLNFGGENCGPEKCSFGKGYIGGWNCDFQERRIQEEGEHKKETLASWFNELKNYNRLHAYTKDVCDETIDKQTILIKLDYTNNMYSYFTNFINLYATMHMNNKFSDDNQVIIWNDHGLNSDIMKKFDMIWPVFSKNELIKVSELKGKKVCLKRFIFSLLPRMVNGLYYKTPLVNGCSKTGLFDAFNKQVIHRLNISQDSEGVDFTRVRVTILRSTWDYGRITNQDELITRIRSNVKFRYDVEVIDPIKSDFISTLKRVHKTDILIGMYGPELAYCLFLPDWASLLDLYDFDDDRYRDLARLRGINYFTLKKDSLEEIRKEDDSRQKSTKSNGDDRCLKDKKYDYHVNVDDFEIVFDQTVNKVKNNKQKLNKYTQEVKPNFASESHLKQNSEYEAHGKIKTETTTKHNEEL